MTDTATGRSRHRRRPNTRDIRPSAPPPGGRRPHVHNAPDQHVLRHCRVMAASLPLPGPPSGGHLHHESSAESGPGKRPKPARFIITADSHAHPRGAAARPAALFPASSNSELPSSMILKGRVADENSDRWPTGRRQRQPGSVARQQLAHPTHLHGRRLSCEREPGLSTNRSGPSGATLTAANFGGQHRNLRAPGEAQFGEHP